MPVPIAVRNMEIEMAKKKEKLVKELKSYGLQMKSIPTNELEGDEMESGPVTRTFTDWYRKLDYFKKNGQEAKASKYEQLHSNIVAWRYV